MIVRLVLTDAFNVDADLDVVAYQEASRLQGRVPVQIEVLAVDGGRRAEADALSTPGVRALTRELSVHGNLFGNAVDGEIADDHVLVLAPVQLHALALEDQLRVMLRIKEIGGAEVVIPLGIASVDARDLCVGDHLGAGGV